MLIAAPEKLKLLQAGSIPARALRIIELKIMHALDVALAVVDDFVIAVVDDIAATLASDAVNVNLMILRQLLQMMRLMLFCIICYCYFVPLAVYYTGRL